MVGNKIMLVPDSSVLKLFSHPNLEISWNAILFENNVLIFQNQMKSILPHAKDWFANRKELGLVSDKLLRSISCGPFHVVNFICLSY